MNELYILLKVSYILGIEVLKRDALFSKSEAKAIFSLKHFESLAVSTVTNAVLLGTLESFYRRKRGATSIRERSEERSSLDETMTWI